jgi:hypothetical protein
MSVFAKYGLSIKSLESELLPGELILTLQHFSRRHPAAHVIFHRVAGPQPRFVMSGSVLHEVGSTTSGVEKEMELRDALEGVASELGQTLTLTAT